MTYVRDSTPSPRRSPKLRPLRRSIKPSRLATACSTELPTVSSTVEPLVEESADSLPPSSFGPLPPPSDGNEKECGEGLKRAIADGIVKREDVYVVSKLWYGRSLPATRVLADLYHRVTPQEHFPRKGATINFTHVSSPELTMAVSASISGARRHRTEALLG